MRSNSNIQLYNGDCFEIMQELMSRGVKVDHIICDPPYNINIADWDNNFDFDKMADYCYRIVKHAGNVILFCGWSQVCNMIQQVDKHFELKNWIIWDRIKGRGATKNLVSTREDILWYTNNPEPTYHKMYSNIKKATRGMGDKNGHDTRALTNVWYDISPIVPWSSEKTEHPSQKPVELMERIVNIWTNEGETVLDFTMGSGTTGVACRNLGRHFIGIEREEQWFNVAKERIEGQHIQNKSNEEVIEEQASLDDF